MRNHKKSGPRIDLTGRRFGRLEVKELDHRSDKGHYYWKCLCDCGEEIVVYSSNLLSGDNVSCGCYHSKELSTRNYKHGFSKTRLEHIRKDMYRRCYAPKTVGYPRYGGRGIIMCDEWKNNPASFFEWAVNNGYEEHLTIDRINNNGNYEPSNCKWSTMKEQANNTRRNRYYTVNGLSKNINQWSNYLGIKVATLYGRLYSGWSEEKTFTTPLDTTRKKKVEV